MAKAFRAASSCRFTHLPSSYQAVFKQHRATFGVFLPAVMDICPLGECSQVVHFQKQAWRAAHSIPAFMGFLGSACAMFVFWPYKGDVCSINHLWFSCYTDGHEEDMQIKQKQLSDFFRKRLRIFCLFCTSDSVAFTMGSSSCYNADTMPAFLSFHPYRLPPILLNPQANFMMGSKWVFMLASVLPKCTLRFHEHLFLTYEKVSLNISLSVFPLSAVLEIHPQCCVHSSQCLFDKQPSMSFSGQCDTI